MYTPQPLFWEQNLHRRAVPEERRLFGLSHEMKDAQKA